MMNLQPLTIHTPGASQGPLLFPAGALALPAAVDTAAWAVPVAGELRLLINHPGAGETRQWRVLRTQQMEPLPSLPLVAAGAACCGDELVVTGADTAGRPFVLGVAANGGTTWRFAIPGSRPARWPVPGCAPQAAIVWQASAGELEAADAGPEGIRNRRAYPVGGPPLEVALGNGALWAAWNTPAGIRVIEVRAGHVRPVPLAIPSSDTLAVGVWAEGACLAWTRGGRAFFSRLARNGLTGGPLELDLGSAANGTLELVPGPEPLVWAQYGETREGEDQRWNSALVLPGGSPLMIEGLVHAVAWWGDTVVVVGSGEIRLLKQGNT